MPGTLQRCSRGADQRSCTPLRVARDHHAHCERSPRQIPVPMAFRHSACHLELPLGVQHVVQPTNHGHEAALAPAADCGQEHFPASLQGQAPAAAQFAQPHPAAQGASQEVAGPDRPIPLARGPDPAARLLGSGRAAGAVPSPGPRAPAQRGAHPPGRGGGVPHRGAELGPEPQARAQAHGLQRQGPQGSRLRPLLDRVPAAAAAGRPGGRAEEADEEGVPRLCTGAHLYKPHLRKGMQAPMAGPVFPNLHRAGTVKRHVTTRCERRVSENFCFFLPLVAWG
mmetsp:Transcript_79935/g.226131  ORF Transcript_79935/g.226131 Transcript_79935/m.226131 type:complete len:282 (+) Transcript_79935:289-1134(+)